MDPVSAVGIALSVAGLAGQVFKGCIQVQIQCLFKEFEQAQKKNHRLATVPESSESDDEVSKDPAKDASNAHVPLPEGRRKFIIKAMKAITTSTKDSLSEGRRRLRWAAFDKEAFEGLLQRFSTLNDNMTDILDVRLQNEIHRTTQDTNRGVLQLHKDLASLHRLVQALDIKMQARNYPVPAIFQNAPASDAAGLRLLAQLAKFKAFNEALDTEGHAPWNEATAMALQLGRPETEKANTRIDRSCITFDAQQAGEDLTAIRCEATYTRANHSQKVWIEWKEYDYQKPGSLSPPPFIIDRVSKLASLLHHSPKPEAFRVPHCLGYFDNAKRPSEGEIDSEDEEDSVDTRIGFVFEKPHDEGVSPNTAPVSLFELLTSSPKPRVTERVKVAYAIANCLLYLHSVNWLHKGLRSHNIVFFPTTTTMNGQGKTAIDYSKPYLSGFDFARPARADEMTEIPGDNGANNMYRHPLTQGQGFGARKGFRKSFDIYSLGVVLVELAHWKTIERVLGVEKSGLRVMGRIREMLLEDERVAGVGAEMGELYECAMWKCVAGGKELGVGEGVDETGDAGAARLGMAFYEDVVKRLESIRI
ncbi:uncharacterized protein RSE6_06171 [Rhynchosporium secalis]|uniref:Protein kinase domain-containing protein n=1 Tax=Rhynchosporium secalis TaxID=38038 RepID=A0A1E1M9P1_RHYSE|nr:uncharacterized protein RSE6_06171 [Rhynchosporium secalis]